MAPSVFIKAISNKEFQLIGSFNYTSIFFCNVAKSCITIFHFFWYLFLIITYILQKQVYCCKHKSQAPFHPPRVLAWRQSQTQIVIQLKIFVKCGCLEIIHWLLVSFYFIFIVNQIMQKLRNMSMSKRISKSRFNCWFAWRVLTSSLSVSLI